MPITSDVDGTRAEVRALLRDAHVPFAFVHGSRVHGEPRADSDLDVAAWLGPDVDEDDVRSRLPAGVDLLVLDHAPLELAGRVALDGEVLLEQDPAARVRWQAMTRKVFLDERPRVEQARADFAAARRARAAR